MQAIRSFNALILLSAAIFLAALSVADAGDPGLLSIHFDRREYAAGESIEIQVSLKDAAQSPVSVLLEADYPNGSVLFEWVNNTDLSGVSNFSFRLPRDAPAGTYNITATCQQENASLQAQSAFVVVVPNISGPFPVLLLASTVAIGLLAAGIVITATEIGKYGFVALLAPLFTRLNRDEALDNSVRYQLLGYLTENPGQHYNALKKALNITNGGMVYHLLVLEREGFIRSQRDGILKRFYPASVKAPEIRGRTPGELVEEIIASVDKHPGITQKELVERLVVSDEVVGYHLRKLVRDTRIVSWKKGKTKVYYPSNKGPI